jgi:hypothetical protein
MFRAIIVPLICASILFSAAGHPYYLSVTELKYNAAEKSIEGSVKVFVNDLESALRKLGYKSTDLINVKDENNTLNMLSEYLRKRLVVNVDGKLKPLTLLGFEHEKENLWLHIKFTGCVKPRKVTITNSILYDFLKEQMNIVHYEAYGKSKSAKVTNPEKLVVFVN